MITAGVVACAVTITWIVARAWPRDARPCGGGSAAALADARRKAPPVFDRYF